MYINHISINVKEGKKLEVSENWRSVENDPPEDNIPVIVMYLDSANSWWEDYDVTVGKLIYYDWIDCLNAGEEILNPVYWRPFPGVMD